MFRRLPQSLPKDPEFPQHLGKLGYFINDKDEIRKIEYPDEYFQFFITDNERFNESQREAVHGCVRNEVINRMANIGVPPLYLPDLTSEKPPPSTPHLAILATRTAELRQKKRIVLIIGQANQDVGVLSYRVICREGGIASGSVIRFVQELLSRTASDESVAGNSSNDETPGVIVLNPGQLLYSHKHAMFMTHITWDALPRPSAAHPPPRVHQVHNHIRGSANATEHVEFAMQNIIHNREFVSPDAEIYIVGICNGGDDALKLLEQSWPTQQRTAHPRIAALALMEPLPIHASSSHVPLTDPSFVHFLRTRSRAWVTSPYPPNTPLANATPLSDIPAKLTASTVTNDDGTVFVIPDEAAAGGDDAVVQENRQIHLQPKVASGAQYYDECVFPSAFRAVVDWFEEVARGGEGYENEELEIPKEVREDEAREIQMWRSSNAGWGDEFGGSDADESKKVEE